MNRLLTGTLLILEEMFQMDSVFFLKISEIYKYTIEMYFHNPITAITLSETKQTNNLCTASLNVVFCNHWHTECNISQMKSSLHKLGPARDD